MSFTVIIPSRSASNLIPCVESVQRHEPTAPIIVVDDGVDWMQGSIGWHEGKNFQALACAVRIIAGVKPFCFARNCNLGIKACDTDVILLNDDALLETPFGLHELSECSKAHPEFGVISAVTNVVGNLAQQPRGVGLREEARTVAFVCVYIPRKTIELVGLMDERFGGIDAQGKPIYGYCDNDYCRRVRNAGLKLGIFDDCFVDHASLKSTFRGEARAGGDTAAGRELYQQKWGDTV